MNENINKRAKKIKWKVVGSFAGKLVRIDHIIEAANREEVIKIVNGMYPNETVYYFIIEPLK